MVTLACEHCGAPEKVVSRCGYVAFLRRERWSEEEIANYVRSGADPPCSFDEYDEEQRRLERSDAIVFWFVVAAELAIASIIIGMVS